MRLVMNTYLYNGSIVLKRKRVSRIFLPIYLSYNK